ncbi:prolipoprotein diacylglyceryl transferase [Arthrobacter sp. BHU FT2]|uniref:Phosphatidylglycerol--prolipoprotein diacylglyceryl transferase n=1 Tax=Pseudarthrobacter enclensis TaxID=993070 RepID=A0A0V8IS10_9MICC|nr:prolipoprotein diacylglyceryl transferase [Pseudarthrobacter enclensis]KSU77551.1 prolipoprotein diacylglyceryl transferase [Pseudarthrobacter enclensis]MBT2250341.1 prolipoprotein diacylglyceryl transferase [Arthrobacter sp. BHU FT2]SCB90483.1 prolipoprotein diacylglyceryl transferase [Pseudarthrobacter enclensis]
MQSLLQAAALAPALLPASIPSPGWSGFDIPLPWGALRIHAYALCILAGIIAGLWLTSVRWAKRGAPEGSVWDIVIWAIPFGIIGGRLYHVFSSPDAYFGPGFDGTGDLSLIPQIQRGGLGIWGAVVLGVVGAWIGCRRSGVKLSAFLDAAAPGLLLAQALGRWGNWFNQELFGGPTTLPWGLQIDPNNPNFPAGVPADTLFHPTFLYESLWNVAGVVILLALDRRFSFRRSRLFWLYAMYYTLGRVWIEAMRIDDAEQVSLFGITTRLNVWTSILVFVLALAAFILLGLKKRPEPDTVYLPGREPAEKDAAPAVDGAPAPGVTGTSEASRDTDTVVSDSESRDNLPDNQSGSRPSSVPAEKGEAAPAGAKPGTDAAASGHTGSTATGTAPEAGSK